MATGRYNKVITRVRETDMAADAKYSAGEIKIISEGLLVYKEEVGKLMKKTEKLGLPEHQTLKKKFLEIEALRNKVFGE